MHIVMQIEITTQLKSTPVLMLATAIMKLVSDKPNGKRDDDDDDVASIMVA